MFVMCQSGEAITEVINNFVFQVVKIEEVDLLITFPALSTGATLDIRQEELRRLLSLSF